MKKLFYLILCLVVFSCINVLAQKADSLKNQPDTDKTNLEIMPLKIGNYWLYKGYPNSETRKYLITDTIRFDGELWYEMSFNREFSGYSCNKKDGLWVKLEKDSTPYLYIKYPTIIGDKYEYYNGKMESKVEVIDTKKELTTTFGTVYAYVYKITQRYFPIHYIYYIPSIGFYGSYFEDQNKYLPELFEFNVK